MEFCDLICIGSLHISIIVAELLHGTQSTSRRRYRSVVMTVITDW